VISLHDCDFRRRPASAERVVAQRPFARHQNLLIGSVWKRNRKQFSQKMLRRIEIARRPTTTHQSSTWLPGPWRFPGHQIIGGENSRIEDLSVDAQELGESYEGRFKSLIEEKNEKEIRKDAECKDGKPKCRRESGKY
jgi:hypothetical protein